MPSSAETPNNAEKFQIQSTGDHPTHAVILVGGIHDTYHYWDGWKESLSNPDTTVIGYNHDHTKDTMPHAAHELAEEIDALKKQGITDITVVAHSMGGLVAKGALDDLVREGQSGDFKHVELYTYGTPFGGFALAEPAHYLPGAQTISNAVGFPMGPDIGPGSDYMKALCQKWPENMDFHMCVGSADNVARPEASSTRERYSVIEANANSVTVVEDFKHTDYQKAGASLMLAATQQVVEGFESVPMNDRGPTAPVAQKATLEVAEPSPAPHEAAVQLAQHATLEMTH